MENTMDHYRKKRQELASYLGSDTAVEWLLRITAATESAFRDQTNSDSGAAGIFQFLPSTRENIKAQNPWLPDYTRGDYDAQSQYAIALYSSILAYFKRKGRIPAYLDRFNRKFPTYPLRQRTRLLQYGYHAGLRDEPPIRTSKKTGEKQDTSAEVSAALHKVDAWWNFALGKGPSPSKRLSDQFMTGDILTLRGEEGLDE